MRYEFIDSSRVLITSRSIVFAKNNAVLLMTSATTMCLF
jgi:hypothetical protein